MDTIPHPFKIIVWQQCDGHHDRLGFACELTVLAAATARTMDVALKFASEQREKFSALPHVDVQILDVSTPERPQVVDEAEQRRRAEFVAG